MRFQLNITLTEEDYLAFNSFHSLESAHGRKQIQKSRIFFISVIVILMALVILFLGWTTVSVTYVVLVGLFALLYTLLFKKIIKRNIMSQLKIGKLPFDTVSKLEFHEDRIVEITDTKHIELLYNILERICVVKDHYIYLYTSSVQAYILPIAQLKEQLGQEEFMGFISQKCNNIEHYQL